MPNIAFTLPIVYKTNKQWEMIDDCLQGEIQVKFRRERYLPKPNPTDISPQNIERYNQYLLRAVFYNVSKRTRDGLVGQIFIREPQVKVPTQLDLVVKDIDDMGVTLAQQAKSTTELVLAHGRAGLLVDYPVTESGASVAQLNSGEIRPTVIQYKPWNILNWRIQSNNAQQTLILVVLKEQVIQDVDGFEYKLVDQYRVLQIINSIYQMSLYDASEKFIEGSLTYPKDSNGINLKSIPFTFVGVSANDASVDPPPLYDICSLNLAHYRNSADYEENTYIAGQATPVLAGLTEQWVNDVLGGVVTLGSRAAVMLPTGATAELIQAEERSAMSGAMDKKEAQMVALGAKLVVQAQVQRTATEADQENTSEGSVLSSTAKNVAAAYKWALEQCGLFVGIAVNPDSDSNTIDFELNTEFDLVSLTAQERAELINEWQKGAITFEEMRDSLRRCGVATLPDDEAKTAIQNEQAADFSFSQENMPEPEPAPVLNINPAKNPTPGPAK